MPTQYMILYRIEKTDDGTPAFGIYMHAKDDPKLFDSHDLACNYALQLRENMLGFGYELMTCVVAKEGFWVGNHN